MTNLSVHPIVYVGTIVSSTKALGRFIPARKFWFCLFKNRIQKPLLAEHLNYVRASVPFIQMLRQAKSITCRTCRNVSGSWECTLNLGWAECLQFHFGEPGFQESLQYTTTLPTYKRHLLSMTLECVWMCVDVFAGTAQIQDVLLPRGWCWKNIFSWCMALKTLMWKKWLNLPIWKKGK